MAVSAHPTLESRKSDHIALTESSRIASDMRDRRFDYEPLFSGIQEKALEPLSFLGKTFRAPIWISSMTGGTELALKINHNLARAAAEFGLGMGLGSCRALLEKSERFKDFDVRDHLGDDRPLFANLGIAQIEKSLDHREVDRIQAMVARLRADGLIIHINPLQEWLQPEGDRYRQPPLHTIQAFLAEVDFPVIVKEVGQGMGPKSLRALLELPLAALDLAAQGGTNFSKMELLRSEEDKRRHFEAFTRVGHSAEEMVAFLREIAAEREAKLRCRQIIISGGIQSFLDGYYLIQHCPWPSVYGQAASLLKHAKESYAALRHYLEDQIQGFQIAAALLRAK